MQTNFTTEQLLDAGLKESEKILRTCVHCGFCTATCPTYVLLNDELDSPRGRIYLIKDMLENDKPANADVVRHVDRCLSCLSCMSTCPSGVHYMHLVDHARAYIEETYDRPFMDRLIRSILVFVLPHRSRFRLALMGGKLGRVFKPVLDRIPSMQRFSAMLSLVPSTSLAQADHPAPGHYPAPVEEPERQRVALLTGCAQPVLRPQINDATIRLLNRLNVDVVLPEGEGCCGALVHHMGRETDSLDAARRNVDAWWREKQAGGLDAILITASGCGTTIKDYGYMLRDDPAYAEKAAEISALAKDITEYLDSLSLPKGELPERLQVTYHSACSMQHGQQIKTTPKALLKKAGFAVKDVPEGHLCCGSAGTYNIMQPEIAEQLKERKLSNIMRTNPDVIAAGNIGCITQLASGTGTPIVHTVELLDWAYGGPRPEALEHTELKQSHS
ncbi:glycolate oxidase subunit GlcF [Coralliovum pocilloporae]|uniref:glycolate oxidase subunit GlcF n=1 Tax=Coralliovum pocilloporae TaxID=3066369 RepID=UPI003306BBC3